MRSKDSVRLAEMLREFAQAGVPVRAVEEDPPAPTRGLASVLGVTLPGPFNTLLAHYRELEVAGWSFLSRDEVIESTTQLRVAWELAPALIPFLPDGGGGYYFMVCKEKAGDFPGKPGTIVYHHPDDAEAFSVCAQGLFEFLAGLAEESEDDALGDEGLMALVEGGMLDGKTDLVLADEGLTPVGLAALLAAPPPRLVTLDLGFNPLGDEGARLIAQAKLPGLRTLGLRGIGLTAGGAQAIAQCHVPLEALDLSENAIGDDGAAALTGAPCFRTLGILALARNGLGVGAAQALAAADSQHLTRLDLSHNPLGTGGARALATGTWPALQDLALAECDLDDQAAQALAELPAGLVRLNLNRNAIGDAGVQALVRGAGLATVADLLLEENPFGAPGQASLQAWRQRRADVPGYVEPKLAEADEEPAELASTIRLLRLLADAGMVEFAAEIPMATMARQVEPILVIESSKLRLHKMLDWLCKSEAVEEFWADDETLQKVLDHW